MYVHILYMYTQVNAQIPPMNGNYQIPLDLMLFGTKEITTTFAEIQDVLYTTESNSGC